MNTNYTNPNIEQFKQGSDQQMDAIAKLTILSLVWSLSGLSNDSRSKESSKTATTNIHVNLSDLKEP